MDHTRCMVTDADRCRLGTLLTTREGRAWGTHRWLGELESLLNEAKPIDSADAPKTLVTMDSSVRLVDCESDDSRLVTLAYPQEIDLVPNGLSVFDPLGIALIGCEVGDVVQCPDKQCKRRMRIDNVVHQQLRCGSHHL
jgi:regulator of nucleoside diphosphate kinase